MKSRTRQQFRSHLMMFSHEQIHMNLFYGCALVNASLAILVSATKSRIFSLLHKYIYRDFSLKPAGEIFKRTSTISC